MTNNPPKHLFLGVAIVVSTTLLAGCQQDVVHQRSITELTQKAQMMLQAGDYPGAVARLEAAYDLQPEESKTIYNLAVAYQMHGSYEKAAAMFSKLLDKPGFDQAEIHKALGITYEAQADKLSGEAHELVGGDEPNKKSESSAKAQALEEQAEQTYQLAISHYEQALPGLKNPEEVQKQIEVLKTRNDKEHAGLPI